MSYNEKKAFKINFKIFVFCDYNKAMWYMNIIRRSIIKRISRKILIDVECNFTDRII